MNLLSPLGGIYFFPFRIKRHTCDRERESTHGHLSALAIVLDMNVLIERASAPGVTGVAEATRLVDLAVATEGLIVVGAYLTAGIDLLVADLHANALGRALLRVLKSGESRPCFFSSRSSTFRK